MQQQLPQSLMTPALRERVAVIMNALPADVRQAPVVQDWMLPLCAVSSYLLRVGTQYPQEVAKLVLADSLIDKAPPTMETLQERLAVELADEWTTQLDGTSVVDLDVRTLEALQQKALRCFRHRQMYRILWRDLTGVSDVYQTLAELSVLANVCVSTADEWAFQTLSQRYGLPQNSQGRTQRLIVLGMGKLGGLELNVSSDIDLICLWPEAGLTTGDANGKRIIDNAEFFRRSVQLLTRLLNSVTEDGFVFRVDTRLRPFGDSGPLVMNFEGLENYYLTQARDWERYAMIKARALTGDADDIDTLMGLITPFVYRRYLDYNAFDSLRELKRKIRISVREKGLIDNIKLGAGGIREIEFIGQAFQLVRGGRDKRLRTRSIVSVLRQIASDDLLSDEEVSGLLGAYTYLRRVENAVQMMRDQQVHSLPTETLDQQRLLAMLDESDWSSFRDKLAVHQNLVSRSFTHLFEVEPAPSGVTHAAVVDNQHLVGTAPTDAEQTMADKWVALGSEDIDDSDRSTILADLGFTPDDDLLRAIEGVSRGPFFQRLTVESRQRVSRIVPMIMMNAIGTPDPADTLSRCVALVRSVAGRSGYLQVLCEQPDALARLVRLFSQSRWLASFVLRQPMVIDELLTAPGPCLYLGPDEMQAMTRAQVDRVKDAELDAQMDSLRHYRQGREMRIACAQLDGTLSVMQVSDQLSWLAESLIEAVLTLVEIPLQRRHGKPYCVVDGSLQPSSHAVVAYGKLGGLELGFGSDLDLVFLHDSAGTQQQTEGETAIDNSVYYARLAQKFVHFMGTATPAGKLYDIDLRLRPNGTSGVLVTGIHAFADYQRGDAWTWEHQALIRARMVFGPQALRQQFAGIKSSVIAQQRSDDELREAVAQMRERMRAALGNNQPHQLHLKQDAGGVADIEFIVQYLVLANSVTHPVLLEHTDNMRILDTVEQLAIIPAEEARLLKDSYLMLRQRLHLQALQEADSVVPLDSALEAVRDAVIATRTRILGVF